MASPKPTHIEICAAFANGTIKGGIAQALMQLPHSPRDIEKALQEAITARLIEHSGNPRAGWLTKEGLDLLDAITQSAYRKAQLRRGVFLGAG